MSELSEQEKKTRGTGAPDAHPARAHMTPEAEWEERLAVARAKREKLLRAKGKTTPKPKLERPVFLGEDDGFDLIFDKPAGPEPKAPPTQEASGNAHSAPMATDVPDPIPAAQTGRSASGVSVRRIITVVFACFFGLGFGMVLSFGAVVAMGWISLADIGAKPTTDAAIKLETAPEILGAVGSARAPAQSPSDSDEIRVAQLNAVDIAMRHVPRLFAASAPDFPLGRVFAPAPGVDAMNTSTELVALDNIPVTAVAMTFENPARLDFAPALASMPFSPNDPLPFLPEQNTITTQMVLASLAQPQLVENIELAIAHVPEKPPVRMTSPDLFKSALGEIPRLAPTIPLKLAVHYASISDWTTDNIPEARALPAGPSEDVSLAKTPRTKGLAPLEAIAALPFIEGPSAFKPNLVFKLGLTPDAAKRFGLVTFAPTTVSSDRIDDNAAILTATGLPVTTVNRVNFRVSKTHIRYYNRQDEHVAHAIAAEVGGVARDFTTAKNRPPPGRVEVWLSGNGSSATAVNRIRNTNTQAKRQAALKAQLQNSLVNSLRKGEHLGKKSR